jgi:ribonuclease PH
MSSNIEEIGLRPISISTDFLDNVDCSCLIEFGKTKVICSATIEENVPPFLRKSGLGWVTAEYGMLPKSTSERMRREAKAISQSGRTQEIQRLIGRSLRAGVDRVALGERQIIIDCDVIQADGGTRCASICGGWVALKMATNKLLANNLIKYDPIISNIAAVSCGIVNGKSKLDLNYKEDSNADTDANFVMNESLKIIEIQCSAEKEPFSKEEFEELFILAKAGIEKIINIQNEALSV